MIVQLNHLQRQPAASTTQEVVDTLYSLLEEGRIEQEQFARLRVQLDWIQYRQNFRECVMATRATSDRPQQFPPLEVHIDTRQVTPGCLRGAILRTMGSADGALPPDLVGVFLEDFRSFRESIAWDFNRLYWHRLKEWEASHRPEDTKGVAGGQSDANHPDCRGRWRSRFLDLGARHGNQETVAGRNFPHGDRRGHGNALRPVPRPVSCARSQQRGTNYYRKLRVLLGDYSLQTLDRSRAAVQGHIDLCSFVVLDALNPIKTLSFLRHKILHVHLTNVYDNLARRRSRCGAIGKST